MQNPGKIEKIEIVLEEIERMNCINIFKNLKSLTLCNTMII